MYTCTCGAKFETNQAYSIHKVFCRMRSLFGRCVRCGAILYEDGYCPRCRK